MKYRIFLGWVIALLVTMSLQSEAIAAPDLIQGSQVFELQCAGCHVGGGNIIRRGKNLKLKALQKNKVDTAALIASLVTAGKGNMSAYGTKLTSAEIENVSAYVLDQAMKDWK